MKTYTATGIVLGYLWDGTKATYASQPHTSTSLSELRSLLKLSAGNLTGTGDFQQEIGGYFTVTIIDTITHEDKEYSREDYKPLFIGKLSNEDKRTLRKAMINQ